MQGIYQAAVPNPFFPILSLRWFQPQSPGIHPLRKEAVTAIMLI